jgi:hypothetical protein
MNWTHHPRARDYLHDLAALTVEYDDLIDVTHEGGVDDAMRFLARVNDAQPLN